MARINLRNGTAGLALECDVLLLDLNLSLGIAARVALDILLDEALKDLAELSK